MDFYCCFSLITHQNCQVSVSLECIVHRGLCWHGFVMWAATDYWVQWVRQAVISQRDSLHFVRVCILPDLLLSLCGKLTPFCLSLFCLLVEQLQNGTGSQFRHLPASSSSSDLRAGGTLSTDHAGDIHLPRGEPRVELLPTSTSDTSLPPRHPEGPTWRSQDHQKYGVFPQEEDRADLCGGKRKLPSPEGVVRQAALPQPHTGKERRAEEEQEEEEQRWVTRQGAAVQSSESHMLQEWQREKVYQREEGHHPDSQKNRAISGGKKSSRRNHTICLSFLLPAVFIT